MSAEKIKINRAPVLTLWGAVVSERLGFDREEALTLGKAVAGLNAQSKGQRLGIFQPAEEEPEKLRERAKEQASGETFFIEVVGRPVPATHTEGGVRATIKGEPIEPRSVQRYLEKKFGADLEAVRGGMQELAESLPPKDLARQAYPALRSSARKSPKARAVGAQPATWTWTWSARWARRREPGGLFQVPKFTGFQFRSARPAGGEGSSSPSS
jgi:hypothetical protein